MISSLVVDHSPWRNYSYYDSYMTSTVPAAVELGYKVGLAEEYLTEPFWYDGEAELAFEQGLELGRSERDSYTAEELFILGWEISSD